MIKSIAGLALLVMGGPFEDGMSAYKSGDYVSAEKSWRKAAVQGYVGAQFNLGNMYVTGEGVPKDEVEAYKWFRVAAEHGHTGAAEELISVGALLTPTQIEEGGRRVHQFNAR